MENSLLVSFTENAVLHLLSLSCVKQEEGSGGGGEAHLFLIISINGWSQICDQQHISTDVLATHGAESEHRISFWQLCLFLCKDSK